MPRTVRPSGRVHLRPATTEDEPAIVALLEAAHLPTMELREHLDNFVVAEARGRIVGCGGIETYHDCDAGLVRSMAVDEARRGSDVGTAVLRWLIERAEALKLRELYLFTMTAAGFYEKFGFQYVTLGDFPRALRASAQYRAVNRYGRQWPGLRAMARR